MFVDGFSVLTDGRILYLDYTPIAYPFTIVYESIVEVTIQHLFLLGIRWMIIMKVLKNHQLKLNI